MQSFNKAMLSTILLAGGLISPPALSYEIPPAKTPIPVIRNYDLIDKLSNGIADLAEQSKKALVKVSIAKTAQTLPHGYIDPFEFFFGPRAKPREAPRQEGLGSGFFIDLDEGYVLTNNHVIEGADEISLKLANGETYDAKIVGRDANSDIAVVQINDKKYDRKGIKALILGDSDKVREGNFAVALGAPFGLEASHTFGVISAVGRGNLSLTAVGDFIQTDAAINPGNSGGPLIAMNGKVIGINTAIYSKSGGYNGIGFTVPSNIVRSIASRLINDGEVTRGYLGVGLQELSPDLAENLGLSKDFQGVLVRSIERSSPAEKAGLRAGDVIYEVNGQKTKTGKELSNKIGLNTPGTSVKIKYYRNGKSKTANAKLTSRETDRVVSNSKKSTETNLGMELSTFKGGRGSDYEADKGVLVTKVDRNGMAAKAGILEGDLILKVNNKWVDSPKTLIKLLNKNKKSLLWIERIKDGGGNLFIPFHKKK